MRCWLERQNLGFAGSLAAAAVVAAMLYAWIDAGSVVSETRINVDSWAWKIWQFAALLISVTGVWWLWRNTRNVKSAWALILVGFAVVVFVNYYGDHSDDFSASAFGENTQTVWEAINALVVGFSRRRSPHPLGTRRHRLPRRRRPGPRLRRRRPDQRHLPPKRNPLADPRPPHHPRRPLLGRRRGPTTSGFRRNRLTGLRTTCTGRTLPPRDPRETPQYLEFGAAHSPSPLRKRAGVRVAASVTTAALGRLDPLETFAKPVEFAVALTRTWGNATVPVSRRGDAGGLPSPRGEADSAVRGGNRWGSSGHPSGLRKGSPLPGDL